MAVLNHPLVEVKEADHVIETFRADEKSSLKAFDDLLINQQFSQLNVLRKIAKDDVCDLSLKQDLQSIIAERTGLLHASLHYLYVKTASMSDMLERFKTSQAAGRGL